MLQDALATVVPDRADAAGPSFSSFLAHYYARVPRATLATMSAASLAERARAHLDLALQRTSRAPLIRVYNPRAPEYGWSCADTVIEVASDDMPFLVDSVGAWLERRKLSVRLLVHPIFRVRRDAAGRLSSTQPALGPKGTAEQREAFIHFAVARQADAALPEIEAAIAHVLADVARVVADWPAMRARLEALRGALALDRGFSEVAAFLGWLGRDNFTFLGYRVYDIEAPAAFARAESAAGAGLLAEPHYTLIDDLADERPLPAPLQAFVAAAEALLVTKADHVASVHRPVHIDMVLVREGTVDGGCRLHLFAGLFAAAAYNCTTESIPWLKGKVARVFERAGFDRASHHGRALRHVLETFPRDELFQIADDALLATALGILSLREGERVALFVRVDDFGRFVACLVYIPRDRFTTALRLSIEGLLETAFNGHAVARYVSLGDAPHARLLVYVRSEAGIPAFDHDALETAIARASRTWVDDLQAALMAAHRDDDAEALFARYHAAFPSAYRERFSAEDAIADIAAIERTSRSDRLEIALFLPREAPEQVLRLKLFHPGAPIALSAVVPVLEHFGLRVIDEMPYVVRRADDGTAVVIIHDIGIESEAGASIDPRAASARFEAALLAVWTGESENDRFNALVLSADLSWRQVVIVRAYAKYLRQAGLLFSQAYMEHAFGRSPAVAALLVRLFEALFDPQAPPGRTERADGLVAAISAALDAVASADDDRILRRFLDAILCTLRTNYFQRSAAGTPEPYLSIKLDSRRLEGLTPPRPMAEIFVYAPAVEGIHLRGGKVARGGIRWSERREDFRSEILSLMKAQMVKNTVIVPVGAKGGFVVKRPLAGAAREATDAQAIACYRTFISGLLDLTDNLEAGRVVPPADVIRRDDDDPYLVVAADKGTARFSDIANAVAAEYRYWLGDAFASGGSHGYDHKRMGITARGAWELVRRHFLELGRDIDREAFTVAGVGDMSGDVFGNAMLLSPHLRLIAAFDHRHIFIDPDPDSEKSLAERARLFALPSSSWQDYAADALSAGGGVFSRAAKTISLSAIAAERLDLRATRLGPDAVIRAILRAPVDLLWFGGIGTFIKAAGEEHAAAADRGNDAVRIDAEELRCKVIGEGANLGLTQRARIAFARAGGRINTDFIDNAGGVDTSDHEVNFKILLDACVAAGELDRDERDRLLAAMSDEVASLVLRDIAQQGRAISLLAAETAAAFDAQARLIRTLERERGLDRALEVLPDAHELGRRQAAGEGLSRPEFCVLFAETKIWLNEKILRSDLPDDPYLAGELVRYFPPEIGARFSRQIAAHRLRRELIATSITNSLINRMGGRFLVEIGERSGASPVAIARAYVIARDVFAVRGLWEEIEALDGRVAPGVQAVLFETIRHLVMQVTPWLLRNATPPTAIGDHVDMFADAIATLTGAIADVLPAAGQADLASRAAGLVVDGVPDGLARRIAALPALTPAFDIARLAAASGHPVLGVARRFFLCADMLGLAALRTQAEGLQAGGPWQRAAIDAIIDDLDDQCRTVAGSLVAIADDDAMAALTAWSVACGGALEAAQALMAEVQAAGIPDLAVLSVASRRMRALIGAGG